MSTQVFSDTLIWADDCIGNRTLGASPEAGTGWVATSSGGGSPSIKTLDNATVGTGVFRHLLDSTSTGQSIAQTHGGTRNFNLANIRTVNILGVMTNADAQTASFYGVGGLYTASTTQPVAAATNDWSSITELCGFAVGAAGEVFCQTRAGGTDSGCLDTGKALPAGTVQVLFTIDLSKQDRVSFYMTTATTGFQPVCSNNQNSTTHRSPFDMSGFTGCVQPMLITGKATGSAGALTFDLDRFWVDYMH